MSESRKKFGDEGDRLGRFRLCNCARVVSIVLGMTCVLTDSDARTHAASHTRWAIVASADVQATGLPDLLTVELSKVKDIELVERELLSRATRELELATVFGSTAAGKRLRLGKLLKADGLIVLRMEKDGDGSHVSVAVCETKLGARLVAGRYPYKREALPALVAYCKSAVENSRATIRHGIRQVVGVTPFASRNLGFEHHHLQLAYARLLQESLRASPGVVTVEIEEAQAIAKELLLGGTDIKRLTPTFVTGEFEVQDNKVSLKIEITTGGAKPKSLEYEKLAEEEVLKLFSVDLPRAILKDKDDKIVPLTRDEQFQALARQADLLAELLSYTESVALREAALLLKPKDAYQRLRLVLEFSGIFSRDDRRTLLSRRRGRPDWGKLEPVSQRELDFKRRHIEYLIYNRLVSAGVGGKLALTQLWAIDQLVERRKPYPAEVAKLHNDAFRKLYTGVSKLSYDTPTTGVYGKRGQRVARAEQEYKWVSDAARHVFRVKSFGRLARRVSPLDELAWLLTEVAPECKNASWYVADTCYADPRSWASGKQFSLAQLEAFSKHLRDDDGRLNQLYGRLGLLTVHRGRGKQVTKETVDEATALVKAIEKGGYRGRMHGGKDKLRYYATKVRDELIRQVASANGTTKNKRHLLPYLPQQDEDLSPRVQFTASQDGLRAPWTAHMKVTDRLDLMTTYHSVYVMTEKGRPRRLYQAATNRGRIIALRCEGDRLWIAQDGIHVISLKTGETHHIGEKQGLPPMSWPVIRSWPPRNAPIMWPAETRAQFLPLGDGRAVLFGNHLETARSWLAMIEPVEHGYRARVFHKMIVVPTAKGKSDDPADAVVKSAKLRHYVDPLQPKKKVALLVRAARNYEEMKRGRKPLLIDLETLKVTVYDSKVAAPQNEYYHHSQFTFPDGKVLHAIKPGGQLETYVPGKPIGFSAREFYYRPRMNPVLMREKGWIYQPGTQWVRVDAKTKKIDSLTKGPLPARLRFRCYGQSAFYGMIAWNPGQVIHQVHIDRKDLKPSDPLLSYDYVPQASRVKHHAAAETFRKKGGRAHRLRTSTRVILERKWKGSGDDLAALKDLHNLQSLYLIQVGITDDDLRHIAELRDLRELYLWETKVTDRGLAHLRGFKSLGKLRLEGTVGGREFSDAGLAELTGLPRLGRLELYGSGFTDGAIAHLRNMPALRKLRLYDTRISDGALKKFQREKPQFEFFKYLGPNPAQLDLLKRQGR